VCVNATSSLACQCAESKRTPCNSLYGSGVIFLGTVESIQDRPWSEFWPFVKQTSGYTWRQRYAMFRDEIIINFSVQEVFKGAPSQKLSVRINKFPGACGFEWPQGLYFRKGVQYLVYAGESKDRHLWTNHCSNTRLASEVTQDIAAYRKLRELPAPLVIGQYNILDGKDKKSVGAGRTVTLRGENDAQLTTSVSADGQFLFTRVPPGWYRAMPSVPAKHVVVFGNAYRIKDGVPINPKSFGVQADACTEIELVAEPDGKMSGVVVDQRGRPIPNVGVGFWDRSQIMNVKRWWGWDKTDGRGHFEIGPVFPGNYIVGVYIWSPEQEHRLDRGEDVTPTVWFYPGVTSPKEAKIISLKFAEHRLNIRLRVPSR